MGYLNVDPATLGPTAHLNGCCGASDARPGLPGLKPIGVGLYDAQVVSPAMPGVGIGVYDADVVTDQPLRSVKPKRVVCLDRHRLPVAITPTNGTKLDLVPVGVVPGARVVNVGQGPGNGVGYGQHAGGVGYYMPHPGLSGLSGVVSDSINNDLSRIEVEATAARASFSETTGQYAQEQVNALLDKVAFQLKMISQALERNQITNGEAETLRARVTRIRSLLSARSSAAWSESAGVRNVIEKAGGYTSAVGYTTPESARDVQAQRNAEKSLDPCYWLSKISGGYDVCKWGPYVVPAAVVGVAAWLFLPRLAKSAALYWRYRNPNRRYHAKRLRSI